MGVGALLSQGFALGCVMSAHQASALGTRTRRLTGPRLVFGHERQTSNTRSALLAFPHAGKSCQYNYLYCLTSMIY